MRAYTHGITKAESHKNASDAVDLLEAAQAQLKQNAEHMTKQQAIIEKLVEARHEALKYCLGRCDQMWAASIVAKLLGGDFREADVTLAKYFAEFKFDGGAEHE